MIADWTYIEDRLLARSVFGTDDWDAVEELIETWMTCQGFGGSRLTAIQLSVGAAVTVTLPGGADVFVKVWPGTVDAAALAAQVRVQAVMARSGFPAPGVLMGLSALGPGWAVGMAYDRGGVATDVRRPGVRRWMARGLARFVSEADVCRGVDGLPRRALPVEGVIWPRPHSVLFDFEATARGAEWIDEEARRALATMRSAGSSTVVGHHDWSAKNMRMGPDGIAVLYDWDSVFLDRETFTLGYAAAHFPVTWELDVPETPAVADVESFVREYEEARGAAFTRTELAEIEASATYARAYKARCEHALDPSAERWAGSSRESLRVNGPFRFG